MQDFVAQRYDFIVIGGVIAGCIMASRLSERASGQVLLIEAGESENFRMRVCRRSLPMPAGGGSTKREGA